MANVEQTAIKEQIAIFHRMRFVKTFSEQEILDGK